MRKTAGAIESEKLVEIISGMRLLRDFGKCSGMTWARLTAFLLVTAACCFPLSAQNASVQEAPDLKVELRSATGSNRFQVGEVIPVELLVSSSTPNRYLEPCILFREACFGYPHCRFASGWSFDVTPAAGWKDIGFHGCFTMSGPIFEVKSSDLTSEPKKYAYTLSNRFRFDVPGKYTVRLSLTVGLDDESNPIRMRGEADTAKHNSVGKTAELELEIVPAEDAWKKTVLERGMAAWTTPSPAYTEPASPEYLKNQQESEALCNLNTPEAAIAFAKLLSREIDVTHCVKINAHQDATKAEMRHLLVDPDVGVGPIFFAEYAWLLSPQEEKGDPFRTVLPRTLVEMRDALFASLPKKTPVARIVSLETVLRTPLVDLWVMQGSPYDLREPYSPAVIAAAAENYDRLSPETRTALMDGEWNHVKSPLMLPVVRREAEKGDGHALLHWQELDPVAATAFMRRELIRPNPRFSALYLRLPEKLLPAREQQIAANFVALDGSHEQELIAEATFLHRYATRAVLKTVLPVVDQHLAEWSCKVQIPILAYLLKVAPDDARVRLEAMTKTVQPGYCPDGGFFTSLGFMQASPVLEDLAARQIESGTPLAEDAVIYLERYGSAAVKPVVWAQLAHWHTRYVENQAKPHAEGEPVKQEDELLDSLDAKLQQAYFGARGWTLSVEDVRKMAALLGEKKIADLACTFSCGSQISVGTSPGNYSISGRVNEPVFPNETEIDYLVPTDPYRYQINQYACPDLKSLEEKLLQFPQGSKFNFVHTGNRQGPGDWVAIRTFLQNHGYVTGN